jgi:hypothetical protein
MTGLGQKLQLPQCNSNGRFTSVSGHKGRRSWMMRALHMLESLYAPTVGIRRDFQDNLLPVSRVRRRGQAGLVEQARTAVAETCGAGLNRPVSRQFLKRFQRLKCHKKP